MENGNEDKHQLVIPFFLYVLSDVTLLKVEEMLLNVEQRGREQKEMVS